MMLEKGEYVPAKAKVEPSTSLDSTLTTSNRKGKKNKNKRRFSDQQIKSMEIMFESESKLEPRTKLQLAKELDLQPRQVAIWFQNRRARWKSKQLERDYNLLKASYDALASQFESMKKEKQMLQKQLQKLNNLRGNHTEESRTCDGNSTDDGGDSDNGGVSKYEQEEKPGLSFGGSDLNMSTYSEDEIPNQNLYLEGEGEGEELDLMNVMNPATNTLIPSPGNWSAYDANNSLFDQSCGASQWWEIWS